MRKSMQSQTTQNLTEMDLWKAYEDSGKDIKIRNILIERNLNLVRYIAQKLAKKILLIEFEYEDIISFGYIGLIQAIERYDISRGYKFSTYASHRIRGSIIDEIRKLDWVPRSVRSKIKKVKNSIEELEKCLGSEVNKFEIAQNNGLTLFEYNIMNNKHICFLEE